MKHFFSIGLLITSLCLGIFSANFSVVQAQESVSEDCIDRSKVGCGLAVEVCKWSSENDRCEDREKKTRSCSQSNGNGVFCELDSGCDWDNEAKECNEKPATTSDRQERSKANDTYCSEKHKDTSTKELKDKTKTACKNDDRCNWSLTGKCNGKASAKTEDFVKCEKAGRTDDPKKINAKNCTLAGCKVSEDQEQCVPLDTAGIFDETGNEIYDPFGTYKGPVFDGPGLRAGSRIAKQKLDNTISKERSLKNLIIAWTKFALSIVAVLAVVVLIYAGVLYITDLGDGSNQEKAKKIILYTVLGIIIIFGSYAIVNTVMNARFGTATAFEKNPHIRSEILAKAEPINFLRPRADRDLPFVQSFVILDSNKSQL